MSAKEIKALIEVGTSLGYSGEELKQFITEERRPPMRLDKEQQEKEKQIEQERLRTFELELVYKNHRDTNKIDKNQEPKQLTP